jgi:hypothetical protein
MVAECDDARERNGTEGRRGTESPARTPFANAEHSLLDGNEVDSVRAEDVGEEDRLGLEAHVHEGSEPSVAVTPPHPHAIIEHADDNVREAVAVCISCRDSLEVLHLDDGASLPKGAGGELGQPP